MPCTGGTGLQNLIVAALFGQLKELGSSNHLSVLLIAYAYIPEGGLHRFVAKQPHHIVDVRLVFKPCVIVSKLQRV